MRMRTVWAALMATAALLALGACGGGQKAEAPAKATAWQTIEPGLAYVDSTLGQGALVGSDDFVQVHYTGWYEADADSLFETPGDSLVKFDSSLDRGEPIAFPLGRHWVIPGWEKGIPGMHVGGKRTLRI
ncbi:MAG TPA: FKBP-type peptidyl-prolyl cis-trans isomerase, partial [Candidatus Krumholzibacteria bacterium]|nr:FKBP-type peptidyl-prolyl cis-trans isomerase [Candidatus Krumholzibacteria bacterium]